MCIKEREEEERMWSGCFPAVIISALVRSISLIELSNVCASVCAFKRVCVYAHINRSESVFSIVELQGIAGVVLGSQAHGHL